VNVLVTGGSGFVGFNFILYLLSKKKNVNVINLSRSPAPLKVVDQRYSFIQGNVLDEKVVCEAIRKAEYIVNFVGVVNDSNSIKNSQNMVETNVLGANSVFEIAHREEVKKIIHISSTAVYGKQIGGKVNEDAPLNPLNFYGASKAGADLLGMSHYRIHKLPIIIARLSSNYGLFQSVDKLIPKFSRFASKGEPLPIYGDGSAHRDWIFATDSCRAISLLLQQGKPGKIYNITGRDDRSILDVAKCILDILDKPEDLISFIDRREYGYNYVLDDTRIRNEFGWEPQIKFREGMELVVPVYAEGLRLSTVSKLYPNVKVEIRA